MLKEEIVKFLLNNIWVVKFLGSYLLLHEISKLITIFVVVFSKLSDKKVKAITKMMSHSIFTFHFKK